MLNRANLRSIALSYYIDDLVRMSKSSYCRWSSIEDQSDFDFSDGVVYDDVNGLITGLRHEGYPIVGDAIVTHLSDGTFVKDIIQYTTDIFINDGIMILVNYDDQNKPFITIESSDVDMFISDGKLAYRFHHPASKLIRPSSILDEWGNMG